MKKIFLLLFIFGFSATAQKGVKLEGQFFKVADRSTGEELLTVDNYNTIKAFSVIENSLYLLSETCEASNCITQINAYQMRDDGFQYLNTTIIESEVAFGICVTGMASVLQYGMAVDTNGNPVHTISGNQPATKEDVNCLHMTYFAANGDFVEAKLSGYFDASVDNTTRLQNRLLKYFLADRQRFHLDDFELADAALNIFDFPDKAANKANYLFHYNGDSIDNILITANKILSVSKKRFKEKDRQTQAKTINYQYVFSCQTCPEFKED